ncbi:MAG: phosphatase PAP2/dual specificity phosphatase family protein, partial [Microvirga sp.]
MGAAASLPQPRERPSRDRPWRLAVAWLAFLAPFFYLTYGLANWAASLRGDVPSLVYGWEAHIPFWAWTILPYWSINAFYGLSFFVCPNAAELNAHGRRLLTAQVIAVACFLAFPLRFTFPHPDTDGIPGFLFTVLTGFDKPFNQAPSLHIALLVILWDLYARVVPAGSRALLHAWFALIGLSVLTTYQHHFIDVPTGALLGFLCLWAWPLQGQSPLAHARFAADPRRRRLAAIYALAGLVPAALALRFGGAAAWLLYPAVSLGLVAMNYAFLGPAGFQKGRDGALSLAARVLLAPYCLGAWINSRLWTRRDPNPVAIAAGVHLGRIPSGNEGNGRSHLRIVDVCAELPSGSSHGIRTFPMLDLVGPAAATLRAAADAVEEARASGPVLVCCALGYARSAAVVAAWLLRTGRARTARDAAARILAARPAV